MVILILIVISREEGMKFISQLSVPLLYGKMHLVSTFKFKTRAFRNFNVSKDLGSNFY